MISSASAPGDWNYEQGKGESFPAQKWEKEQKSLAPKEYCIRNKSFYPEVLHLERFKLVPAQNQVDNRETVC